MNYKILPRVHLFPFVMLMNLGNHENIVMLALLLILRPYCVSNKEILVPILKLKNIKLVIYRKLKLNFGT